MEERFHRAKIEKSPLIILSVDISNAFESVSHAAIGGALLYYGTGNWLCSIITDIYDGADTRLLTDEGFSKLVCVKLY